MAHGGGGGDRWLISYADFITLLMVLFVVLYSMGQTDVQRYKALAESLRRAFSGGGPAPIVDPGISAATGGTDTDTQPAPVEVDGFPQRGTDALDVASDLSRLLSDNNLANGVSVQNNIEGLLLSLSETLLFVPGGADLLPEAYPLLQEIAVMLNKIDNEVRVTAYTDDTPPTDPRYPTNWELSAARSASIVRFLISQGLSPERLSASGRGEYHPLFPNDTPEHRAYNRRAEIAVVYVVEENSYVIGSNSLIQESVPGTVVGGQTQP
ncbi:MAG: OmpA family protein [Anaerolineales bacterium]|nr:OmpA family protein [Anaerolineales bacterium]